MYKYRSMHYRLDTQGQGNKFSMEAVLHRANVVMGNQNAQVGSETEWYEDILEYSGYGSLNKEGLFFGPGTKEWVKSGEQFIQKKTNTFYYKEQLGW